MMPTISGANIPAPHLWRESSPISFQIEKMKTLIEAVLRDWNRERPLTMFQAERRKDDTKSLLRQCHYNLTQLCEVAILRDHECIWLDKDCSRVGLYEEASLEEKSRCNELKALMSSITHLDIFLTPSREFIGYDILAYKTHEVYVHILRTSEEIRPSIEQLLKDRNKKSPLVLRGVKQLTDELSKDVETFSEFLQWQIEAKVNAYTVEWIRRFIKVSIQANKIAGSIFELIFTLASQEMTGEEAELSFKEISWFRIYDTAYRMKELMKRNAVIFNTPTFELFRETSEPMPTDFAPSPRDFPPTAPSARDFAPSPRDFAPSLARGHEGPEKAPVLQSGSSEAVASPPLAVSPPGRMPYRVFQPDRNPPGFYPLHSASAFLGGRNPSARSLEGSSERPVAPVRIPTVFEGRRTASKTVKPR